MDKNFKLVSETIALNEEIEKNPERAKTVLSILGMSIPLWTTYRAIRAFMDEGTRRCGVFGINTARRRACMLTVKIKALEMAEKATKDPTEKRNAASKIKMLQLKLGNIKELLDSQDKAEMKPKYKGTGTRIINTGV